MSSQGKTALIIVLAIFTVIIPIVASLLYIKSSKSKDLLFSKQENRTIPYMAGIGSSVALLFFLNTNNLPQNLDLLAIGALITTALAFTINFKWKISAHSAAMGGLVSYIILLRHEFLIEPNFLHYSALILLAGIVAASRIYLNVHSLAQVVAGFALGFIAMFMGQMYY